MKQWLTGFKQAPKAAESHPVNGDSRAAGSGDKIKQADPVIQHLLKNVRSKHVHKHFLSVPAKDYTETKDLKLLAGSYNVAGKKPPSKLKLTDWLDQWRDSWPRGTDSNAQQQGPDIIAIGFQEVVPLSAGNVIAGPNNEGANAWDYALACNLNGEEWAAKYAGKLFGVNPQQAGYMGGGQGMSGLMDAMEHMWSGSAPSSPVGKGSGGGGSRSSTRQQQDKGGSDSKGSSAPDQCYVQIVSKQLVGVYMSVWVRRGLMKAIRGVQTTWVMTGFGGYLGNKGAVAVRMRVYDSALCLVCSHFASGDQDGDELRRNADFADIMKRCVFSNDPPADPAAVAAAGGAGHWGALTAISEHQNVIWMGDLNYRLNAADEEARKLIKNNRLDLLIESDQLLTEMSAKRVFQGWREGPVSFLPTYKYHLGCNIYSGDLMPSRAGAEEYPEELSADDVEYLRAESTTSGGTDTTTAGGAPLQSGRQTPPTPSPAEKEKEKAKKRTPAWCDRILWLPDRQLFQLAYGRGELTVSDHRPVCAAFLFEAHAYDRSKVEAILEEGRRKVDMMQNANTPKCSVEPNFVDVGSVSFGTPRTCTVTLHNGGPVDASFHFTPPPRLRTEGAHRVTWDDDQPIAPPWLTVVPAEGFVEAGKSVEITLTVLVEGGANGAAAALSHAASDSLEAICILRIVDGSDLFICLNGKYRPSSFGIPLEDLLNQQRDGGATASGGAADANVPEAVQRLTSYLRTGARLRTPGLFVHSYEQLTGQPLRGKQAKGLRQQRQLLEAVADVRVALDEGTPLPETGAEHQVAGALLAMFQQLPNGLMPHAVIDVCSYCVPPPSSATSLLADAMPAADRAVLRHMVMLLREMLDEANAVANGVTTTALATAIADYWFPPVVQLQPETAANRIAFLMQLLDPDAPNA